MFNFRSSRTMFAYIWGGGARWSATWLALGRLWRVLARVLKVTNSSPSRYSCQRASTSSWLRLWGAAFAGDAGRPGPTDLAPEPR